MESRAKRSQLAKGFAISSGPIRLDSMLVIPDDADRRIGLVRAESGARITSTLPTDPLEQRATLVSGDDAVIRDYVIRLTSNGVDDIGILFPSRGNVLDAVLALELPDALAFSEISIELDAVLIRISNGARLDDQSGMRIEQILRAWLVGLDQARVVAGALVADERAASRARESQILDPDAARARLVALEGDLRSSRAAASRLADRNKQLQHRYEALAHSKLGRVTLLYWRWVRRVRARRKAV